MKVKTTTIVACFGFALLVMSVSGGQQARRKQPAGETSAQSATELSSAIIRSPRGDTFQLAPSLEAPTRFSIVASTGDEQVVSGLFSARRLRIMRQVMEQAGRFAFSDEAVGANEPMTTRFFSVEARGFAIDVSKLGGTSRFFVNLRTSVGRITLDAGIVSRGQKKQEGFFFDVLARITSQLQATPASVR
jgi:hypothetical protein